MSSAKQRFPRYLNATDLNLTSDVAVYNGKYTKVAYYKVPAQQEIAMGIGAISGGVDWRKKATIRFDHTNGVQIQGKIRLAMTNANETDIRVIIEDRTENFVNGVEVAETPLRAKEDSYLVVYFNPDSDSTIDVSDANTSILMPVTVYQ